MSESSTEERLSATVSPGEVVARINAGGPGLLLDGLVGFVALFPWVVLIGLMALAQGSGFAEIGGAGAVGLASVGSTFWTAWFAWISYRGRQGQEVRVDGQGLEIAGHHFARARISGVRLIERHVQGSRRAVLAVNLRDPESEVEFPTVNSPDDVRWLVDHIRRVVTDDGEGERLRREEIAGEAHVNRAAGALAERAKGE